MTDWAKKNLATIIVAFLLPIGWFANNAWIDSRIANQLKGYLPLEVWKTWAEERASWRTLIETEMKAVVSKQQMDKDELAAKFHALDTKIEKCVTILEQWQQNQKRP